MIPSGYSLVDKEKMIKFIKETIQVGESFQLPEVWSKCAMRSAHNPKEVNWGVIQEVHKILLTVPDRYKRITTTLFERIA